jgi:hypothetical protein
MKKLLSIRRYIVRGNVRTDITGCFWCGTQNYVCTLCCARADVAAARAAKRAKMAAEYAAETQRIKARAARVQP